MTGSRDRVGLVVIALAVAVGLAATAIGYAPFERLPALLALLTGWTVAAGGLIAWLRAPNSTVAVLVVASGFAWFIGTLHWLPVPAIAALADLLRFLYLGFVVHQLVVLVAGNAGARSTRLVTLAGYAASLVAGAVGLWPVALMLSAFGVVLLSRAARSRLADLAGIALTALSLTAALTVAPWARSLFERGAGIDVRPLVEVSFVAFALLLSRRVIREASRRSQVGDLVVDLDRARDGDLERELARLLGDPSLRVGFWLTEEAGFVDVRGRPMPVPAPGEDQRATIIDRDGRPVALLVHAPGAGADPELLGQVGHAAELSTTNARLQADLRRNVLEIAASRRRLVEVEANERNELLGLLATEVEPRLDRIAKLLDDSPSIEDAGTLATALLDARTELAGLVGGLGPQSIHVRGLERALGDLVATCPVPALLHVDSTIRLPVAVESAIWFVTGEALTNVVKHAQAGSCVVSIRSEDRGVAIEIVDDGRGGADPEHGTGLRGLRARVEELGGRLSVESANPRGTRLRAWFPSLTAEPAIPEPTD